MSACSDLHAAIPPWKTRAARRAAQRTCEKGDSNLRQQIKGRARQQRRQADRRAIKEQT